MLRCFLALTLAAIGCSSGSGETGTIPSGATVESCKTEYSPQNGYGWEDDLTGTTSPSPDASPPPVVAPQDRAESQCMGAGQPASTCDADLLMTRDAALCIADGLGLSTGISPRKAGLTYHAGHARIVWNVESTLTDDGAGAQTGDSVSIDAIDGTSFGIGSWGATP